MSWSKIGAKDLRVFAANSAIFLQPETPVWIFYFQGSGY